MPKDTFFNLPAEKRVLITSIAVDEFARYPYGQASINRIVKRSGIAKGSFYQYFDGKMDLFLFILQRMASEKIEFLQPVLKNVSELDFFQLLRAIHTGALKFALEYPQYAAIGSNLLKERDSKIYREIVSTNFSSGMDFYRNLVEKAIDRGEVRKDIDANMIAYYITIINNAMVEYYTEYVNDHYDQAMQTTIDRFIDFLEHGLAA